VSAPPSHVPITRRPNEATSTTPARIIGSSESRASSTHGSMPVAQLVEAMSAYTNQW
jgi:hypothetical protein